MKEEVTEKKHGDNSAGVVGVVFGILAIVSGVAGLIFGFIGFWFALYQFRKAKNKWAIWGFVLTIIGFIVGAVLTYYLYYVVQGSIGQFQGLQDVANAAGGIDLNANSAGN